MGLLFRDINRRDEGGVLCAELHAAREMIYRLGRHRALKPTVGVRGGDFAVGMEMGYKVQGAKEEAGRGEGGYK